MMRISRFKRIMDPGALAELGSAFAFVFALGGCAVVDPRADYRRVDEHVAASTGIAVPERPEDAAAIETLVSGRMADGLSVEDAMVLCLVNNPRVRAAYLGVGVARAEVVQVGLLQNPSLSLALRLPDGGGLSNLDLGIAQNIAELWLIPARTRAARRELQRETLEVARAVASSVLETRAAYYAARAADRELEIAGENRGLAQQLVDVARTRQGAGVGSEIDVNLARTELMNTEIAEREATLASFETRSRLGVLLGLAKAPESLTLTEDLPEPPVISFTEEHILRTAETSRLDLVAAGCLVKASAARLAQEKLSIIGDVEVGVSFERAERGRRGDRPWLADTLWATAEAGQLAVPSLRPRERMPTDTVLGPTLSLEVPLFDQNQAQIARADYLHQSAVASLAALRLDVAQESRGALKRAQAAGDLARYYRESVLPLVQTNLELTREAYRGGKLSLLAVIEAQKSLLAARGRFVEALRDGATAISELERAVGVPVGRLSSPTTAAVNQTD